MSDLISRSDALEELSKYEKELRKDKTEAIETDDEQVLFAIANQETAICRIRRNILHMPTAYDVDKVVGELEKATQYIKIDGKPTRVKAIHPAQAIEIVKRGGVCGRCTEAGGCSVREDCPNEPNVCEWKYKGGFIKNPHTNRIYSNEESMKNIYCNTCGKKIKVVE